MSDDFNPMGPVRRAIERGERFDPGPPRQVRSGDEYYHPHMGYPPVKGLCVEIEPFQAPRKTAAEWDRDALSDDVKRARGASYQAGSTIRFGAEAVSAEPMHIPRGALYSLAAAYAREVAGFDPVCFQIVDTGETMYYAPSEGAIEEGWFVE